MRTMGGDDTKDGLCDHGYRLPVPALQVSLIERRISDVHLLAFCVLISVGHHKRAAWLIFVRGIVVR